MFVCLRMKSCALSSSSSRLSWIFFFIITKPFAATLYQHISCAKKLPKHARNWCAVSRCVLFHPWEHTGRISARRHGAIWLRLTWHLYCHYYQFTCTMHEWLCWDACWVCRPTAFAVNVLQRVTKSSSCYISVQGTQLFIPLNECLITFTVDKNHTILWIKYILPNLRGQCLHRSTVHWGQVKARD